MGEPTAIVIYCPVCKSKTKAIRLDSLDGNEDEEEKRKAVSLLPPEMSHHMYNVFCDMLRPIVEPNSCHLATISRIESHRTRFFKKRCKLSNRVFRFFLYIVLDHEKQSGGFTFVIGKEVQYDTK